MSILSDLATKVSADIDAKLSANAQALAAKDAEIASLKGQLAVLSASDADTQTAVVTLQAADAKLTQ